jgi:pyruvate ferredoxin oxidoreductase beta subunit
MLHQTVVNNKMKLTNHHTACLGCAQIVAARLAINQLGSNTIVVNSTGCLEVTTTAYPNSAWQVPWLHSTFANAAPVGSGIIAALDYLEKNSQSEKKRPIVVVQGGDGATFDIGFGALTASWARGDDLLYICYDNEGYANTGMQASLSTPTQAKTPTSLNKHQNKRDMLAIALAHNIPYIAQANIAFPDDFKNKIAKAQKIKGPRYIQILVPCLPGWKIKPGDQMLTAKLASETGLYPLLEFINGQLNVSIKLPTPIPPVSDYIKNQGRYQHLLKNKSALKQLQSLADANIEKYGLCK